MPDSCEQAACRTKGAGVDVAQWFEPTEEQVRVWRAWAGRQPEEARAVLGIIEPWGLYVQPSSGMILTLHGLKLEIEGFSLFVNLIGHVEHEFLNPYYGARVADPGSLKPYEPETAEELAVLAHRASGGATQAH